MKPDGNPEFDGGREGLWEIKLGKNDEQPIRRP
jgi:hypothetical protein